MNQKERARLLAERATQFRAERRKACKCLAVTVVVVGAFLGLAFEAHGTGFVIEVIGLYLVELV